MRSLHLLAFLLIVTPLYAVTDLSLSDILNITPPKVISSTKTEKDIISAPSVMTVFTEIDIKRMGARSVRDLLERTVGFHNSQQYSNSMLGGRGIIADGNAAWLMLIDGHNVNNTSMHGMQSQHIFPVLNNVKRVEIMRGPGSTLWGSDAALGIIHIITKKGYEVNKSQVAFDIAINENAEEFEEHYSFLTGEGEKENDIGYMFSFDWMDSEGWPEGPHYSGLNNQSGYTVPFDSIRDSHQLFAKFNYKKSQLIFRKTDYQHSRLWTGTSPEAVTYDRRDIRYNRQRTVSAEFSHRKSLNEKSELEAKVFGGMQDFNQQFASPYYNRADVYSYDLWSHEYKYGGELTYYKTIFDMDIKLGGRLVRTEYDPLVNGTVDITDNATNRTLNVLNAPAEIDEVKALYTEAEYQLNLVRLIAGLRYDENNLRHNDSVLLPRLGAVFQKDDYAFKLLYNTGFARPSTNFNFFGTNPVNPFYDGTAASGAADTIIYGADKAEKIKTIDAQFILQKSKTFASVTLFWTKLENYFLYSGEFFPDNSSPQTADGRLWIINAGTVTSKGIELEAKHKLNDELNINGNLSYIFSSKFDTSDIYNSNVPGGKISVTNPSYMTSKKEITGFPYLIANLGADYLLTQSLTLNTNVHMIHGGYYENNSVDGDYIKNDLEMTLDVSMNYSSKENYEGTFFVKNIANHEYRVGSVTGGSHRVKGFTTGIIGKYNF